MRFSATILSLLLLCVPAIAQTPASETEVRVAHEIAEAFTDENIIQLALESGTPSQLARLRQRMTSSDFYTGLRPDTRQSLDAYVETMPALVHEQTVATMLHARAALERRLVDRYAEEELVLLVEVITDPLFRTIMVRNMQAQAAGQSFTQDQLTEEEQAALARLEASTELQGMPQMRDVTRLFTESVIAAQSSLQPTFERRLATGFCTALADECPAHIRAYVDAQSAD